MKFKPEDSEYEIYEIIVGTQSRLMYPINSPATETKTVIQLISIETANAKLAEWLRNAPVVYGRYGTDEMLTGLSDMKFKEDTHKARLVCIEPLRGGNEDDKI